MFPILSFFLNIEREQQSFVHKITKSFILLQIEISAAFFLFLFYFFCTDKRMNIKLIFFVHHLHRKLLFKVFRLSFGCLLFEGERNKLCVFFSFSSNEGISFKYAHYSLTTTFIWYAKEEEEEKKIIWFMAFLYWTIFYFVFLTITRCIKWAQLQITVAARQLPM